MKNLFKLIIFAAFMLFCGGLFAQDTYIPFATSQPVANRYAYTPNGLKADSTIRFVKYASDSNHALFTDATGKLFLGLVVNDSGDNQTLQDVCLLDSVTLTQITSSAHTVTPVLPLDSLSSGTALSVKSAWLTFKMSEINPHASDFHLNVDDRPNFSGTGNGDHIMLLGYNKDRHNGRIDATKPAAVDEWEQSFYIGAPFNDTMSERHYNFVNKNGLGTRPFAIYNSHNNAPGTDNTSLIEIVTTNGKIAADGSGTTNFITWTKSGGLSFVAPTIGSGSGTAVYVKAGDGTFASSTQIAQGLVANLTTDLSSMNADIATRWSTAGTTITANQFIGTLSNNDLIFRTANTVKMRLDSINASLIINEATATPTANLETKTISASVNGIWNMRNSAGTLIGGLLEASTGGSGGLYFFGNRGSGGTGNGILFEGYGAASGTVGLEYRALGGTRAAPVVFPSTIAHRFTWYDGTNVPDILTLNTNGSIGQWNAAGTQSLTTSVSSTGAVTFNTSGSTQTFTLSDPTTLTGVTVNTAVSQGSGMKHQRVTTGSITAGTSALVTLTWTSAFANANYTPVVSVTDATAATASLRIVHIESVTASTVVVRVENTSAGDLTGTLNVIAMHD